MNVSYKQFGFLILALLFSWSLSAQSVIYGQPIENTKYDKLWDKFESFDLFNLNTKQVNEAVKSPEENNVVSLQVGPYAWEMELYPNQIHTNDALTTIYEDGDLKFGDQPDIITYKGQLVDNPHSRIDITITDQMVLGIVDDGRNQYFIEKVRNIVEDAPFDEYIIYNINSVLPEPNISCGIDEVHEKEAEHKNDLLIESSLACYDVIIALATDAGMASRHGGGAGAQGHVIGIITLVQANFDNEFQDEINFVIGAHFNAVGTNPGSWNFSTINSLLITFGNWANAGGFGTSGYDVSTLWTTRTYGGIIGLAWVNALCGGNRYNVCVDFSSNSNSLRCLQAHELGHNFSLRHDGGGSPHIMAPSLNGSNSWSSQSQAQMNARIPFSCMGPCAGQNPPDPDFIASPERGCRPMVVNFSDLSSGNPTQWLWTFPGGTPSSSTQQNPIVSYPTPGVYDVTLEVSNNAGSNIELKRNYIEVGDVPVPDFDVNTIQDEAFFIDQSIVYGAADYLWDFGDGEFSTVVNPTHTYDRDGVYVVTLTIETLCGTNSIQKTVTIVTPPTAEFRADTTDMCAGTSITFTNLSSYNSETYKWRFSGGSPETSTNENPTVYYDSAGVFTVELVVSNSRYMDLEKKTDYIEVDTPAIAEFDETIDLDSLEVQFENETENGRSFAWDFGDGETSTKENPEHTYAKDSIYNVTFVTTNHCGTDTTVKAITVGRLPEAGFEADPVMGCLPHDVTFEDTSSANTTRRIWKFEGGDPLSSTEESPTVSYTSVGTFKVTLIAINGLGNDTVVQEDYITIETQPESDFQYTRNDYEIDFQNESEGATSFDWDFGDGNSSTDENPTHTYNGDGEYNVILIVSNGCGMDTVEQIVEISNNPNANFTADKFVGCVPMTVQLENQSSPNTESVEWLIPGGNPGSTTVENPVIEFNNPGLYRVQLIAKNSFGNDTIIKRDFIEVLDVPEADFDFMLNGFNVEFEANTKYGKDFEWNFGDGANSDLENPTHVYTDEGTYRVILVVSNICGTDTFEQDIIVTPRPVIEFTASATEICIGDTVYFTDNSANQPTSWNWAFEGGNPDSSDLENPVVVYNSTGTYRVQLEATNQFGSNESVLDDYITVYDDPVAMFTSKANSLTVQFTNESEQIGSVEWDFGDGEVSTEESPTHKYQRPGTYTVTLVVRNACGESTFVTQVSVRYRDVDIFQVSPPPSPNPSNGVVRVEHYGKPGPSIKIKVAGLDGQWQQVYQGDFMTGELKQELDLSFLTEGTYFLFFETDENVTMSKMIIQK